MGEATNRVHGGHGPEAATKVAREGAPESPRRADIAVGEGDGQVERSDESDADGAPDGIGFDAWARLSASLQRRAVGSGALILHAAGVDRVWHELDEHWFAVLAAEIEAGDRQRLERYVALCAADVAARCQEGASCAGPLVALMDRIADGTPTSGS